MQIEEFEHHYVQINGMRMHYVRAGSGNELVILLHGFPEFWYSWRHQIAALSKHYTVVCPDLRGYNETQKPGWGYELDVLVQDIVELIRALGHTNARIAGHDWGGVIAWALAITYPQRVKQLVVLNAPHLGLFGPSVVPSPRQMLRSLYILFFQIPFLPEFLIRADEYTLIQRSMRDQFAHGSDFSDEEVHAYKQAIARPGALTAALNYYRAMASQRGRGMFSGTGLRVTMPTLLIWGEEDAFLGRELIYGTERFVPDLRIRYIERCSHWVQQERPDEVNAAMLEFFGTKTRDV